MLNAANFFKTLCIPAIFITTICSGTVHAEGVYPGEFRGTYHLDRWNQGRFGYLFVAPELHERLQKTHGRPCILDVTKIDQPMNPGGAMATEIGEIRYQSDIRSPVELCIQFDDESKAIKTLTSDQTLQLRVTMTNRTAAAIPLAGGELLLNVNFHYPSGAGTTDPMGYWWSHNGMTRHSTGQRVMISGQSSNLLPVNQSLDAQALHARLPGPRLKSRKQIPPGKSHTWTTSISNIPPNEFEISVLHIHLDRKQRKRFYAHSNILRFNVVTNQPQSFEGLSVRLKPINNSRRHLKIVFTNHGNEPLRFALLERGGEWDCARHLLYYDAEGTLLKLAPLEGEKQYSRKTLDPNESLTVKVPMPSRTALARCAFSHRIVLSRKKEGVDVLSTGLVLSPHLVLDNADVPISIQRKGLVGSVFDVHNMAAIVVVLAISGVFFVRKRNPTIQL